MTAWDHLNEVIGWVSMVDGSAQGTYVTIVAAHDDDREPPRAVLEEIPGLGDVVHRARDLPHVGPQALVLEGGGTLTTGGVLEKGKILGGQTRPIKVGDVVYIPSGLPHGVSGVDKNITWLNVRWDTDWPPDSPMGAGTLNGLLGRAAGARAGTPGGAREGSVEARAARAGGTAAPPAARGPAFPPGSQQVLPYSYGGSGELFFSKEQLDQIMAKLNSMSPNTPSS